MSSEQDRDQSVERLLRETRAADLSPVTPACVDAEKLAAWADGALPAVEARAVESHLSDCGRCQAMLAVFSATEPVVPAATPFWQRWSIRVLVPLAAGAAAVLVWATLPKESTMPAPAGTIARVEAPGIPGIEREAAAPPAAEATATQDQGAAAKSVPLPGTDLRRDKLEVAAEPPASAAAAAAGRPVSTPPAGSVAGKGAPAPADRANAVVDSVANADTHSAVPLIRAQSGERSSSTASAPVDNLPIATRSFDTLEQLAPGVNANNSVAGGGARTIMMDGVSTMDSRGNIEIVATAVAARQPAAGGAGGRAGAPAASAALAQTTVPTRWRILVAGGVERSTDGGASWQAASIGPPVTLTNGSAPSALVCWLIGPNGVVLLTSDGLRFRRVAFPEASALSSIRATSALVATVTTADGRTFTTADGGTNWTN